MTSESTGNNVLGGTYKEGVGAVCRRWVKRQRKGKKDTLGEKKKGLI